MAMPVDGTAVLGDVICFAEKHGAVLQKSGYIATSPEFNEPYRPEHLVMPNGRYVQLPKTNDRQLILDVPMVDHILTRLGCPIPSNML